MPESKEQPGAVKPGEVVKLAALAAYQSGAIVSREIIGRSAGTVTVFAFDAGQGLSEHTAPFDALVHVIEGEVEIRLAGQPVVLTAGDMVIMPAQKPHALKAVTRFKMVLTMLRA